MKHFRIFSYLGALAAVCLCAGSHTVAETVGGIFMLSTVLCWPAKLALGACISFSDLATATESLSKKITKLAFLNNLWLNAIPTDGYPKNTGVEQTTFTMKNSEPSDIDDWETIVLDGANNNTPSSESDADVLTACPNDYDEVPVGYYTRTYAPERLKWRGPIICRDQLTYQHNVVQFLNGYETRLVRNSQRKREFWSRERYMGFATHWSDGVPTYGPGALASVTPPRSDITQGQLDVVANELISDGATEPDSDGFIMLGGAGYLFTLEIASMASQRILKNNTDRRQDARWAMAKELWRRIGATTVIANYRHACTNMAPRANSVNGVLTRVRTFKTATEMTSNNRRTTPEYDAAQYEAAIVVLKSAMTAELVTPENYNYKTDRNYMGALSWIEGGERILSGCSDPEHNLAAYFGRLELAARPDEPNHAQVLWYKRPPQDIASSDLYAYSSQE